MSTEKILFPKIGFAMEEGTLTEWLVKDGDTVKAGQPLYSLESDKSVVEIESPASGKVKIDAKPGEVYQVGAVLGEISE